MAEHKTALVLEGGAITDAVPFKKALEEDFEKTIVILTRPKGYRKKKSYLPYNLFYKNFPNLVKTTDNYYKEYNETMDLIEKYEEENKIIVFRPSKFVKVKRVEKNKSKLQKIYDLGVSDCMEKLEKVKEYTER